MTYQIQRLDNLEANGAAAFDAGLAHEGHGLPAGHPAIDAWQMGWRNRRTEREQERYDRIMRKQAVAVRTGFKPRINLSAEELSASLFAMVLP